MNLFIKIHNLTGILDSILTSILQLDILRFSRLTRDFTYMIFAYIEIYPNLYSILSYKLFRIYFIRLIIIIISTIYFFIIIIY